MQGFIRPVACIGSGDPVRVLCLYTTITLDEVCSVYCWVICTTCHYQSMCYSTCTSGPTMLSVCSRLCLVANCLTGRLASVYLVLYCTMSFIATCVDAIGTVFWDRPQFESKNLIQFSHHCLPKCANHIHSQWDELMNRFRCSPVADWLERNDIYCFFCSCMNLLQIAPSTCSIPSDAKLLEKLVDRLTSRLNIYYIMFTNEDTWQLNEKVSISDI